MQGIYRALELGTTIRGLSLQLEQGITIRSLIQFRGTTCTNSDCSRRFLVYLFTCLPHVNDNVLPKILSTKVIYLTSLV